MHPAVHDFGGHGPLMHIGLANGFPPHVYAPLAHALGDMVHAMSILPRPLWDTPPAPDPSLTWDTLADDLLSAMDALAIDRLIATGHSLGGVVALNAAARHPERFGALILLDPTLFPEAWLAKVAKLRSGGQPIRTPLADQARKRRARFSTADEAFNYWRAKPLFADWSDDVLWHYVDGILTPDSDGSLTLRWSPDWEATLFETLWTDSWRDLSALPPELPLLIIRGQSSDSFAAESYALLSERMPHAETAEVPGGHLFPQTASAAAAAHIRSFLTAHGLT